MDDGRVADRYVLDRELSSGPGTREFRARDTTLDRWVRVRTLRADDSRANEFLDAARRAATLTDVHVPRVLDAGTDLRGADLPGGVATVFAVVEDVDGRSLTELLRAGPLPVPAVRALVGESAGALEAAARRGLHHTRLTPDSVVLGLDGVVRVLGIGLEAALEDDPPAVSPVRATTLANRADAVGLVGLVYAGLTGLWPAAPALVATAELPRSPLQDGGPTPPKDLRVDVPNDLDTLCVVTFGPHGDGPRDPAELALQLAPWSMEVWQDVTRDMRGERATAEVRGRLKNRDEVVP
ncbi:MAG: protein kinase family protein, partial [Janthinobacterium lividum]